MIVVYGIIQTGQIDSNILHNTDGTTPYATEGGTPNEVPKQQGKNRSHTQRKPLKPNCDKQIRTVDGLFTFVYVWF